MQLLLDLLRSFKLLLKSFELWQVDRWKEVLANLNQNVELLNRQPLASHWKELLVNAEESILKGVWGNAGIRFLLQFARQANEVLVRSLCIANLAE